MASAANESVLAARVAMIDSQLKPCGVVSPRLVSAFYQIAREPFVAAGRRGLAYTDAAQSVAPGRELLPPLSLGLLLQKADIAAGDHVLVVGAATGYSAAILSLLARSVVALECDPALAEQARRNLASWTNISVVEGPLDQGWADSAPYGAILVDGASERLPEALTKQLRDGGKLLAIEVGADGVSRAAMGIRHGDLLSLTPFDEAPGALLPSFGKPPAFRF